jgi:hypothetical protein
MNASLRFKKATAYNCTFGTWDYHFTYIVSSV